jgi:methylmalonyl-CoA mutase N-terminal domain/subunit
LLQVDQSADNTQREKLAKLRACRDDAAVSRSLAELSRGAATASTNTMPLLIEAVRAYATLGEICDALRGVFGVYTETNHV